MLRKPPERLLDALDWSVLSESMAHEVNNLLNNILLHLAVLEQGEIPTELRSQTAAIRQKGRAAAATIKSFQQRGVGQHAPLQPIDLNAVARDAVSKLTISLAGESSNGERALASRLELAADLPHILGDPPALERLLETLLSDALAPSVPPSAPMLVRTGCVEHRPRLWLEYSAPVEPTSLLQHFLRPVKSVDTGQEDVRYAICKTLARRLRAALTAEPRADGGATLIIDFLPAKSAAKHPGKKA